MDSDGWDLTPSGIGIPAAGGLGGPRIGMANLDLNANSAAVASYPNMGMYTNILQPGSAPGHRIPPPPPPPPTEVQIGHRAAVARLSSSPGSPPSEGNRPSWQGRDDAGARRCWSKSLKQRQAAQVTVDDDGEDDEEEEDESMLNQHSQ
ncbi:hypothetical protein ACP70R_004262 [Stipagrostis hirtigluma subsp. patula]